MVRAPCLVVPRERGEETRRRLLEEGLLDTGLKIRAENQDIYLPLRRQTGVLEKLSHCFFDFEKLPVRESLESRLGFKLSYEIIGSLAILISPLEGEQAERAARALLEERKVKTVLKPITAVEGEYRTRNFQVIEGVETTETLYREHGCTFKFDLARVYFSPRLSTERLRVAGQVRGGETVVDMFAGVGPFSIIIARSVPGARVIAVDKNPLAIKYLKENLKLNRLSNVEVLEGDIRDFEGELEDTAHHMIMNLPHQSHLFLDTAQRIARPNAKFHFYTFASEYQEAIEKIKKGLKDREITVLDKRIVRSYAPHEYNICIEFSVQE